MLGQAAHRKGQAAHSDAKTTKGWGKAEPRRGSERTRLYAKCGPRAFLLPNPQTPGQSKFPVMSKAGACVIDCRALRVAKQRASQHGYAGVKAKADALGRRGKCRWAK
jgi:hypothetical protein